MPTLRKYYPIESKKDGLFFNQNSIRSERSNTQQPIEKIPIGYEKDRPEPTKSNRIKEKKMGTEG